MMMSWSIFPNEYVNEEPTSRPPRTRAVAAWVRQPIVMHQRLARITMSRRRKNGRVGKWPKT